MRLANYFFDKTLPKYLDPKTVLIYRPHSVLYFMFGGRFGFSKRHGRRKLKTPIPLRYTKLRIFLTPILEFALFLCQLCQNIKILQKKFLIGPFLGEVRFFRVVLGRVGNFRQIKNSAEDGIDGTNGYFRRNSGCSAEQKISEFRSEPFAEEKTTRNSVPWTKNRSKLP